MSQPMSKFYRRLPLVAIAIVLAGVVPPAPISATEAPPGRLRRPNIVLLLADDMRADAIGATGNPAISTPNIDSLARGGVTFRGAHIMGSQHVAVCIPSRAMLLSGRSLFRLKDNGQIIPPESPTYPELLRRSGYVTFATGKWHNDRQSFARSFSGGAAIFFGGMTSHSGTPVYDFDPSGKYPRGASRPGDKYSSTLFTDAAVAFIRSHKGDAPFYVHLAYTTPHDPREVPPGYKDRYDVRALKPPENFLPEHPFDNGEMRVRDELLAERPRSADYVKRELATYYAMITHMDEQVGRVLAGLKEAGHAENTIVVFAADHGLALGSHGLLGKQNLYEHSVRVPLIVRGPGIPAGQVNDALCYLMDVCPTLLECAGAGVPQQIEGRSLLPVLKGEKRDVRGGLFLAYRDVQRGFFDGRFKLIEYWVSGRRTTQLFDLKSDPHELHSLAGEEASADVVARLQRQMAEAQRDLQDPEAGKWVQ